MKNINAAIFILLLVAAINACASDQLRWESDGTVVKGSHRVKTGLQNAYTAMYANDGVYVAGFKIDASGINFPFVAYVEDTLETQTSWPLDDAARQFFQFEDQLFVLMENGQARLFKSDEWVASTWVFKPGSTVLKDQDDIVACNPAPRAMAATGTGSCYSLFRHWNVEANWQATVPKVCGDALVIPDRRGAILQVLRVALQAGVVTQTKTLQGALPDLCEIPF